MSPLLQNLWLSRAAGFGPTPALLRESRRLTVADLLPKAPPGPLTVLSAEEYAVFREDGGKTPEARRERRRSFRERTLLLGRAWMDEMARSDAPLGEKAALFWHGHFATRIEDPWYDQLLLQTLRNRALGPFEDLLREVSQSAAMLRFLNNNQNRKDHPNENFAREVMELFTLGRGHYTEADVREAARAFSGWSSGADGTFVFRRGQHDDGEKTIFGQTGRFDGNDVLRLLVGRSEVDHFITQKAWRFFISDEAADPRDLKRIAARYRDSGLVFTTLLEALFAEAGSSVRGTRIKGPVELLAGYQRLIPARFEKPQAAANLQRGLGQILFFPPNVGGWPGGRAWIDSSSLALRMRLPEALYGAAALELRPKELDAEVNEVDPKPVAPASAPERQYRIGKVEVDWSAWEEAWSAVSDDDLPKHLAAFLLSVPPSSGVLKTVTHFSDHDSREDWLRSLTIRLLGLPEYQLV